MCTGRDPLHLIPPSLPKQSRFSSAGSVAPSLPLTRAFLRADGRKERPESTAVPATLGWRMPILRVGVAGWLGRETFDSAASGVFSQVVHTSVDCGPIEAGRRDAVFGKAIQHGSSPLRSCCLRRQAL